MKLALFITAALFLNAGFSVAHTQNQIIEQQQVQAKFRQRNPTRFVSTTRTPRQSPTASPEGTLTRTPTGSPTATPDRTRVN